MEGIMDRRKLGKFTIKLIYFWETNYFDNTLKR